SARASSDWLATEVYSPVAIEIAPATRPASPVSTTVARATLPPATPAISAKLDTRPSITPNTAGRNQPPVTSRWLWWISIEPGLGSRPGPGRGSAPGSDITVGDLSPGRPGAAPRLLDTVPGGAVD